MGSDFYSLLVYIHLAGLVINGRTSPTVYREGVQHYQRRRNSTNALDIRACLCYWTSVLGTDERNIRQGTCSAIGKPFLPRIQHCVRRLYKQRPDACLSVLVWTWR